MWFNGVFVLDFESHSNLYYPHLLLIIEATTTLKDEVTALEQYTTRDVLALNSKFQQSNDEQMKELCALGKVNPLNICPGFYTSKVIVKE